VLGGTGNTISGACSGGGGRTVTGTATATFYWNNFCATSGTGSFNQGVTTGPLDGGAYTAGTWRLGQGVAGSQPSETHQIIVEIDNQLYVIGAALL
jgi:hypothetical protein